MLAKLFPQLFIISLTILTAFPVTAQITEATLKGSVKDSFDNPIVASAVIAQSDATSQIESTTTDENGSFVFASMPPGFYTIYVRVPGFKTYELKNLKLNVGQAAELNIKLEIGDVQVTVQVDDESLLQVSNEARISDTVTKQEIQGLPLSQRDVFALSKLSAGATAIPGAANSTKLTNSPVVTVNGNRYRGNNYVLDGSLNVNANNTGEPSIVPSVEVVEEVQVQTSNFSAEFGRGNGSVVNMRTKSGTNEFRGQVWTYHRDAAFNARNFFSRERAPQVYNQYGGSLGGPIIKKKTFFFGSYEGTRHALARPYSFQVETPELRNFVSQTRPNGIAARLFHDFPSVTPLPGINGQQYQNQTNITVNNVTVPATGTASVNLKDYIRFDQYLVRLDHAFTEKDKISVRWIAEYQRDEGGTSSATATLGKAMRGERGFFDGAFGNFNFGYSKTLGRSVNDLRFSAGFINTNRGNDDAIVPEITITGITAPFGDIFNQRTKLRTYEIRDTYSLAHGRHTIRFGGEGRRIFKGLSIGPPSAGTFAFTSVLNFINDAPARQTLTVDPQTGRPAGFPRYFSLYEFGVFGQDDFRVNSRLNLNLGMRWDYFGDAKEREGLLSSIIPGPGATFQEQITNAAIGRVERLYKPQILNFSPRLGLAFDPFGDSKTSIRIGLSLAYQPHHGQSIAGARALPPDAVQIVSQPSQGIGTQIFYGIPVPFNPEFARGLNQYGGVNPLPGETRRIRPTGFVVNPDIKTQYSEAFFLNIQRQLGHGWIAEVGYNATLARQLERIDDVNRFRGDLLDGVEDRLNPNFGTLLFVTNGVKSDYHGVTFEIRKSFSKGFSLQTNYRFSKWLDTSSDTSTGQFQDNSEPGKGAQDIDCLKCERAPSMFDIPHRFSFAGVWNPQLFNKVNGALGLLARGWQVSAIVTAQSGRPFSVYNGAAATILRNTNGQIIGFSGGDYNLDAGGGAVGGGFYDRPNAPLGLQTSFNQQAFLNGIFPASAFIRPAPGANGTLGRNTFRGPSYTTVDLSIARQFSFTETMKLQLKVEAYNALNNVNLYLPVADLSLPTFGKSTQAFEPRNLQLGVKFTF